MTTASIDDFLTEFVRRSVRGEPLPACPFSAPASPADCDQAFARIAFHGIALLIAQHPAALKTWPEPLRQQVKAEARAQSFWELSHRQMLASLIKALGDAGVASVVTKGSALAYTLYDEPALRRRGDSDLLLPDADRQTVARALRGIGMEPVGDVRPLQESWAGECTMGFSHVFDLHWRGNASAVISECLDRAGIGQRTVPLPRVSSGARGIAPTDNVILIAINRALHGQFGYISGDDKTFEEDRLIWAVDLDLLCGSFSADDWAGLTEVASASGTAPLVLAALDFAAGTLGTAIPDAVRMALAAQPGDPRLLRYCSTMPGLARLRLDLTACPGLADKLRLTRYTLFPGAEVLHERFPDAAHWPIPALQARRLLAGAGKLVLGRG